MYLEKKLGETSTFILFTLTATVFGLVGILWNRSIRNSRLMAQAFFITAAVLSFGAFLCILLNTSGILAKSAEFAWWLRILIFRAWLIIGTAISSVFLILLGMRVDKTLQMTSDATRYFVTSPYLLRGLCLSVAISFICTEIGKVAHDAEMRQFFVQSGYPVWFLYFIIVAETVGAVGLLVPKTILPAALGLSLIMTGAIRTHLHNHDPFSDSLEALHLLMLLNCIVLIRQLRSRVQPWTPSVVENVVEDKALTLIDGKRQI
jgi:putative oxidoreductase